MVLGSSSPRGLYTRHRPFKPIYIMLI
jgi:hypothetical protein